jgi:hypothetical protein
LSDKEIKQFIEKQLSKNESELCDRIIKRVESKSNDNYKSFLRNPLLLTMFILTFQSHADIPERRSEFYSQVFESLYSSHDSISKLGFIRERICGLSKDNIIEVLKYFSYISFFEEKFLFSAEYLNSKLKKIKDKKKNIYFDNSKFIDDLQISISIIVKDGPDYSFPHRSLQEYFAALFISYLDNSNKKVVYDLIMKQLFKFELQRINEGANFYQLLTELDKNSVIEFIVIPLFEFFIVEIDSKLDAYLPKEIVAVFSNLLSVFRLFSDVVNNEYLLSKDQEFDYYFHQLYYFENDDDDDESLEKADLKYKLTITNLAFEHIKPFLNGFKENLRQEVFTLKSKLSDDKIADFDIISLVE